MQAMAPWLCKHQIHKGLERRLQASTDDVISVQMLLNGDIMEDFVATEGVNGLQPAIHGELVTGLC